MEYYCYMLQYDEQPLLNYYTKWKKPDSEVHIVYEYINVNYLERVNP